MNTSSPKMPAEPAAALSLSSAPELVFGLVAPIGVDLDVITEALEQTLHEMNYEARRLRLTQLMREIPTGLQLHDSPYVQSFKDELRMRTRSGESLGTKRSRALL